LLRIPKRTYEEMPQPIIHCDEFAQYAPTAASTDGEASNPGPQRLRRRGPRSTESMSRRLARRGNTVPDLSVIGDDSFSVLHVNIRGYLSHLTMLSARLQLLQSKPQILCLNETFLNKATPFIYIEGYECIARLDRKVKRGGGVAVFARKNIAHRVSLLAYSKEAERAWLCMHTNRGPYLLCCWYRRPNPGEVASISSFHREYEEHCKDMLGTIIVGDLNVHQRKWLRHSVRNSLEGALLQDTCNTLGLSQLVRDPTREDNLLDLVLSNNPLAAMVRSGP
jgi:hypothetical protein